jgi:hypothetical protein
VNIAGVIKLSCLIREPDGSISNNLYVSGVDSIDPEVKERVPSKGQLPKLLITSSETILYVHVFKANLYVCFYNEVR